MAFTLSQSQYAKAIGLSQPRISKLIKQGKIKRGARKVGRHWKIDKKIADAELKKNLDPANRKKRAPAKKKPPSKKEKQDTARSQGTAGLDYNTSRTLTEQYKAAMKKLEYEKATGKVVLKSEVEKEAFEAARATRDQLMAIPDRLDSVLAAEKDPHKINRLLVKEIKQALGAVIEKITQKN